jgi:pyrroline-5-carboxylate reductase
MASRAAAGCRGAPPRWRAPPPRRGELLHRSDLDAATLRRNVTSPGGTTAAALEVLMAEDGGMPELMRNAVAAAARLSRELAK